MGSLVNIIIYDIQDSKKNSKYYRNVRKILKVNGYYRVQKSIYAKKVKERSQALAFNQELEKLGTDIHDIKSLIIPIAYFDKTINISGESSLVYELMKEEAKVIRL